MAVANSGDVVHLWTVSGEPGGIPLDHGPSRTNYNQSGKNNAEKTTARSRGAWTEPTARCLTAARPGRTS